MPVIQDGCLGEGSSSCPAAFVQFHQHCHSTKASGHCRLRIRPPPAPLSLPAPLPPTSSRYTSLVSSHSLPIHGSPSYVFASSWSLRSVHPRTCLTATRASTPYPTSTPSTPSTPSRCHVMPSPPNRPIPISDPVRSARARAAGPACSRGASSVVIQLPLTWVPQARAPNSLPTLLDA